MNGNPEIKNDPLYQLLRNDDTKGFNSRRAQGEQSELTNCDMRGLDLRGLNAEGLDMRGCYFRQSDLRGIDFSKTRLEGASIKGAKISGTLFPVELSAEEINLSLQHGTRMRYR